MAVYKYCTCTIHTLTAKWDTQNNTLGVLRWVYGEMIVKTRRGIKLVSNLQNCVSYLKFFLLKVPFCHTYNHAQKIQAMTEARQLAPSLRKAVNSPRYSLCTSSLSMKTRFKSPILNVNVSLVLSSRSVPSSPGAKETSNRTISKLITARISINASCLPMQAKGPVFFPLLSKALTQVLSRLH